MVMNWYILFLISLPEAALNLYIILQIAGQDFLNFKDKKNIFRFCMSLTLMLVSSLIIRPNVTNVAACIIVHSIAYMVIICFFYRLGMLKAFYYISFFAMLTSAIENAYLPFIIVYISKGFENFSKDYWLFVIYAIPYRLIQIGIILLLKKYNIVFDMVKITKDFNKTFSVFLYLISFVGFTFSAILYESFDKISLTYQIAYCVSLWLLTLANTFLVFKIIYVSVKGILTGGYQQYQKLECDTSAVLNGTYDLLKDNNSEGAKKLLESYLNKK